MKGRGWRQLVVCVGIALVLALPVSGAAAATPEPTPLPALPGAEAEPNDAPATASPIASGERIRAALSGATDVDVFRFTALAGERVFANVVTAGAEGAGDSTLTLVSSDGTTDLESDNNDGSQGDLASSIAGFTIPATPGDGTYYLRVESSGAISPYDLYLQLRPAALPPAEVEASNNYPQANPLSGGEVSGEHASKDEDWYSFFLNAGDTVFLSLQLAGADVSNAQLAFGITGDSGNPQRISARTGAPDPLTPSEALTMTVAKSGTYYATVASTDASPGDPAFTYDLSVGVIAASQPVCRSYASAGGPIPDGGTAFFPVAVEDQAQITRAAVGLNLKQPLMQDLDLSLRSPAGTELPLFSDVGAGTAEEQTEMEAVYDDYAAVPPLFKALRPLDLQPEGGGRLAAFAGQSTQGTWTVTARDDTANGLSGSLRAANLILCGPQTATPPRPSPPAAQQAKPAPPRLTGLTFAPSRFQAAKAGPMVQAKRAAQGGALVTFQLSESAQTNFVLYEAEPGRKVGGKCVPRTRANAAKKTCTRMVKVINFVRTGLAGRNRFGFNGRVGARKLPPGEYQLQGRAYAPSGLVSDPAAANFTVLPPSPAK